VVPDPLTEQHPAVQTPPEPPAPED
jgi:hypothetical protein